GEASIANGIDTDLSNLWWLNPKGWQDTGPNTFLEGQRVRQEGLRLRQEAMRLGQQESQFNREQVMQMLNYNLREKEANVKMAGEIQQQKDYHDFLDDMPKVNAWRSDPTQPPPTDLKSPKSIELIDQVSRSDVRLKLVKDGIDDCQRRLHMLATVDPLSAAQIAGSVPPGQLPAP